MDFCDWPNLHDRRGHDRVGAGNHAVGCVRRDPSFKIQHAKGFAVQDRCQPNLRDMPKRRNLLLLMGIAMGSTLTTQVGCIPFVANMIHAVKGQDVPPEYPGLKDQRVALITISDTSQYSDDVSARMLNRYISEKMVVEVKDIKLVREDEVDQWRDTQGWSDIDYVSLGRGVKADKVVAVEMTNLRLRDGQTMYRGEADITVTVHNVADGTLDFRRTVDKYTYPVTAAIPVTEMGEERFRRIYLQELASRVARFFHPYDFRDSVARDATIVRY